MYGAEAVILTLSRCLNAAGHRSSIAAFTSDQQPNLALRAAADSAGVRMDAIICAGQVDRRTPEAIRALSLTVGTDVIHAHGYKADVYGWLAMRKTGIPLVSSCHTWYDNDLSVKVYGAVDRRILRRFAGVVAVSEEVRLRLLKSGVSAGQIRLIYNGVDPSPFAAIEPWKRQGTLRVGLVGRLATEKGIDLFLAAAVRVLRTLPETEFVVAGDGPDRAMLETLLQNFGLASKVRLVGRVSNMPTFYESLDVLVSSSRQEGLPVALLEAMASGLPIVATAVGEVPRLLQHRETGLLVSVQDVQALAESIEALLRDRKARTRYGLAARQSILKKFSAERMSNDYLRLYRDVAASSNRAPKGKL